MKALRPALRIAALLVILITAAVLRFTDLNWDQSQYNHPDERHVNNVLTSIQMPSSLHEYFDSGASPMNPYNKQQGWVYGMLPLLAGKSVATFLDSGCAPVNAALPRMIGQLLAGEDIKNCNAGYFTGYQYQQQVSRLISALADLLTVLVVFLTGRHLFGWRTGLLAAAFSALAALQIQHSKFAVVDAITTTWTALSLYFAIRVSTTSLAPGSKPYALWANVALSGLFAGFAVASKISVWPLAALLVLAIVIALLRDRRGSGAATADAVLAAILAGVITFGAFRITQPYGFVGNSQLEWQRAIRDCSSLSPEEAIECERITPMPETVIRLTRALPEVVRPILAPSPRWVSELQNAALMTTGQQDPPFGWQWANRAPVTFPLGNIVFYGLGVPLGLAAVAGALFMLAQAYRGRRWHAYVIPALWTIGFFLYQGTQYVKSIRYQLPIYPMLCIAAAAFLVWLWRRTRTRVIGALPAIAVLGGTIAWCAAFMNIYNGDNSRTEASRWIFQNAPTALTLNSTVNGAARQFQIPAFDIQLAQGARVDIPIRISGRDNGVAGPLTGATFHLNRIQGEGEIEAVLLDPAQPDSPLGRIVTRISSTASTLTFDGATLKPDTQYLLNLTHREGSALSARTSRLGNQHWDEALPHRLDGKDSFGGYYTGIDMQVYNEEDPGKDLMLLDALDNSDYIVLSSNRHYASVARLPWRFPMTNRYYERLLGGQLGFKLVADFHDFPRLGPYVFYDQEMPQQLYRPEGVQGTDPGIAVPYPKAEEAFSVYDHQRVLIFQKTPEYSRALAERQINIFDLTRSLKRTAFASNNTPGGLRFDATELAIQQNSGTWRDLYPRESPLNQSQTAAVLALLLLVEGLGLASFFVLAGWTRRADGAMTLIDGGFAVSKVLGLLLTGWLGWLFSSLKIVPFSRETLLVISGALVSVGLLVGHLNRAAIFRLLRERWGVLLAAELVFLISFGFWLLVRSANPDLWHLYFGGEKPMDLAMLNSVLKASIFPPQDGWFAGGYINYYYLGFALFGWPLKALGIDPAVGYNLLLALLFALTACGAYGVAATIVRWLGQRLDTANMREISSRGAAASGILAALCCVYIGNITQFDLVLRPAWQQLGGGAADGLNLPALVSGFAKWLGGETLPIRSDWLYWNASRPAPEVVIGEFPQFTFLYADLHAHMMAMPLALLTLALALAFSGGGIRWGAIALAAASAGALWGTNTWDYFPYLLLCVGGLVIGALHAAEHEQDDTGILARWLSATATALPAIIVLAVLTRAFYAPFLERFGQGYGQIDPWIAERTQIATYLSIHGIFLIPIVIALLRQTGLLGLSPFGDAQSRRLALLALGAGLALGVVFVLRSAGQGKAAWTSLLSAPLALLAIAAAVQPRAPAQQRLAWLMTGGALALTFFVEHFTLRGDIGRMNTQFKFYSIAWILLSTAGAAAFVSLFTGAWPKLNPTAAPQPALRLESSSDVRPELHNSDADTDIVSSAMPAPAEASAQSAANGDITLETSETVIEDATDATAAFEQTPVTDVADVDQAEQPTSHAVAPEASVDALAEDVARIDASILMPESATIAAPLPPVQAQDTGLTQDVDTEHATQIAGESWRIVRNAAVLVLAVMFLLGALYPAFAIPAKINDRYVPNAPRGLNGMAYMREAMLEGRDIGAGGKPYPLKSDYDAIQWMQNNVNGSPTIIEGHTGGNAYLWAGRYSIYTGLPSVIGWQWHQRQQRGESLLDSRLIYDRFTDIEAFYGTQSVEDARRIIERYGAKYIIASSYEKAYFGEAGFAKFEDMVKQGLLNRAYKNPDVTIYEVVYGR